MELFCGRTSQFFYFDAQLGNPSWEGKTILDFGGNIGGFLKGSDARIDHENYWCLDIHPLFIEQGRKTFPKSHFVFYNRYNFQYNPTGVVGLAVPDLGPSFDYIFAFSVFTHIAGDEMVAQVNQLKTMLDPDGVLAFTFIDPHFDPADHGPLTDADDRLGSNLKRRLFKRKARYPALDVDALLEQACEARWCTLVENELCIEPEDSGPMKRQGDGSYITYYTPAYIKFLFPQAEVLPPLDLERRHHCCIITKDTA